MGDDHQAEVSEGGSQAPLAKPGLRERLSKYKWLLRIPAILLAFYGLGAFGVNSWQGYLKYRTLRFFDQRAQAFGDSPSIAVAINNAAGRIRGSKPAQVKSTLETIGTEITEPLANSFDTTTISGEERARVVGAHIVVMELLTDDSAPAWIRATARRYPDWYLWLGRSYARQRRYSDWLRLSQVAETLAKHLGNRSKEAEALTDQGSCLVFGWSKVAEADTLFDRASGILGAADQSPTALYLLQEKTRARIKVGDYQEALRLSDRHLAGLLGSSDYRAQAEARELRGVILRESNDLEGGAKEFDRALSLARQWRPSPNAVEASILDEIGQTEEAYAVGDAATRQAHLERALEQYQLSLSQSRAIERDRGVAFEALACGRVLDSLGRSTEALPLLDEAVTLYRTSDGLGHYLVKALYQLGVARTKTGDCEKARGCFEEATTAVKNGAFDYSAEDREYWSGKLRDALGVQCPPTKG